MTGAGVVFSQYGIVSLTLGHVSLKELHPYAHPLSPPSHPAGRCAPFSYLVPWPSAQRGLSLPQPPAGSLRWFFWWLITLPHQVDLSTILRVTL
jgi:hypothetical protein